MRLVEISKGQAINPEHVIRVFQERKNVWVVLTEIIIGEATKIYQDDDTQFGVAGQKILSEFSYKETLSRLQDTYQPLEFGIPA